jgi:pyridoxine 5-phosphate synthase
MGRKLKLGVNIDHIATIRQARREAFPDVIEAARAAVSGGADGIVVHLREDRRHIQDRDVYELRKSVKTRLDLEMAVVPEIKAIALDVCPEMITLVPEKREEVTTEGGLDVAGRIGDFKSFIEPFRKKKINVSLFVDPESEQIEASAKTGANFIEIHTGAYANEKDSSKRKALLKEVANSTKLALDLGLRVNAGHGLDYENVKDIASINGVEELNIGFSIVARAVFVGLESAVAEMKRAISS